jgi:hypothetical protein
LIERGIEYITSDLAQSSDVDRGLILMSRIRSEPLTKRYIFYVARGSTGVFGEGRSEYGPFQVSSFLVRRSLVTHHPPPPSINFHHLV